MKTLGLIRHAKSDWSDSDKRDFDRGLNARGRRGARLMGKHIRAQGTAWEKLVASPAERVKMTLAEALPELEPQWDRRLYLATTETICEVIHDVAGDGDALLLAGHNPGLADMILQLVAPDKENELFDEAKVKFPTASFAVFELAIDDWADIHQGCGRLVHFTRPRDLDPELGPQA